jgi:hypothetical protein
MRVVSGSGLALGLGLAMVACADVSTHVRTRAAHDFGCSEQATRIVDEEVGVYRIEGCGFAATYECGDGAGGVITDCKQVYVSKAPEGGSVPKSAPGSDLAKTQ